MRAKETRRDRSWLCYAQLCFIACAHGRLKFKRGKNVEHMHIKMRNVESLSSCKVFVRHSSHRDLRHSTMFGDKIQLDIERKVNWREIKPKSSVTRMLQNGHATFLGLEEWSKKKEWVTEIAFLASSEQKIAKNHWHTHESRMNQKISIRMTRNS